MARFRPIVFLEENVDLLLMENSCHNIIIVEDLNHHLAADVFNTMLTTHGKVNHVDFVTLITGFSLDPVII